ncbi:Striatin family protein [Necator americanus]|uniref:Striatin family protein n=1 Tax=Necator americanus TaxID=51031 RepID=W2TCT1_NECAM|nr:Striatin family protein [Necator americanus]ETN79845.1 Striatin family protein [Necator americanus]
MEKAKWEMERAEMQARISFLQGERKGQENLKADLIRRIKIAKNYRLTHNGEDPPEYDETENETTNEVVIPNEVDAYVAEGGSALGWKQGRQLLKQYLQEIGYSEQILDVRSFRVKNLLGLIPQGDWPSNERIPGKTPAVQKKDLDRSFFSTDDTVLSVGSGIVGNPMAGVRGKRGEYMDLNDALGLPPDENIDIKDDFIVEDDEESLRTAKWNVKMTLRSHLDSIRAMQFHPVEPVLITAGEDGTAKLWNLDMGKEKSGGASEIEPVYTFRGHMGPVLCIDLSPTGDHLFTGGRDGVICCWNVPSTTGDPYEAYDPKVLSERLRGHKDSIWSIAYHSSDNRLVSASSDGTIKLWEPGNFGEPLLRTLEAPVVGLIPTSVDFVSTEPSQLLAAYTSSTANIIDIETGTTILSFDFGDDVVPGCRITRILSHPTMPLTITAGDDRRIRYFDNHTGKLTHSAVAHVEEISSLAIDPNGLYLLSGSHDGSLRMWNMEKRVCLQEISAHRKKYDASVTCVAFHPSRPLIGSAGADSLAKVYCPTSS